MMMEETEDSGALDDTSNPPSFAVPPGGMQEDTQSETETTSVATPAAADPFDLLSMTTAAPAAPALSAPVNDFDVFGSAPFPGSAPPTSDLLGVGAPAASIGTMGAIDISTQESMIAPSVGSSSPKLVTAESGDLLGLTGPAPAAQSPPPNDFMDSDFQSLPVAAPTNAQQMVDPFGNADLFGPTPTSNPIARKSTSDSFLMMQSSQQTNQQQPSFGVSMEGSTTSPGPMMAAASGKSPGRRTSPVRTASADNNSDGKRFSFSQELAQAKLLATSGTTSPSRQRSRTPPPPRPAQVVSSAPRHRSTSPKPSPKHKPTTVSFPAQQQRAGLPLPNTNAQVVGQSASAVSSSGQRSRTPPPPSTKAKSSGGESATQPAASNSAPKATDTANSSSQPVVNSQSKAISKDGTISSPPPSKGNTGNVPCSQQERITDSASSKGHGTEAASNPSQPAQSAVMESSEEGKSAGTTVDAKEVLKKQVNNKSAPLSIAEMATKSAAQNSNASAPATADLASAAPPKQKASSLLDLAKKAKAEGGNGAKPVDKASGEDEVETSKVDKQKATLAKLEREKAAQERFMQKQKEIAEQKASPADVKVVTEDAGHGSTETNPESKVKNDTEAKSDAKEKVSEEGSKSDTTTSPLESTTSENGQHEGTSPEEEATVESKAESSPKEAKEVVADESATDFEDDGLEEVQLASPQGSGELDPEVKKANEAAKAEALATGVLQPPLLTTNNEATEQEDQSANSELLAKTKEELEAEITRRKEQESKVASLEEELAAARKEVENLRNQKKALEQQHKDSQEETATVLQEIQNKLQKEQSQRAEVENKNKIANNQIERMKAAAQDREESWEVQTEAWKQQLTGLEKENEALIAKAKQEVEDRKEHERRERVLANKLNTIKKQQASKTDVEEVYEDDLRLLKDDVSAKTKQVEELQSSEARLKQELEQEKSVSKARIEQLEKAVREEKQLNEDRKKKMKAFIETKAEELKEAKSDSENYQSELNRNNQSMVDLNNRWKTLHAQWVQSQTRNRELQRDLNKIKKDSENLHKVGDSLNVKLSRSANDIEQHKNKRLAAKQELMSVLGKLEAEREITNKLRDSIRFTFTSKAQSQHQLLQEALTEFNKQLEALARRLGRPLPLTNDGGHQSLSSLVMSAVDNESERSESDDVKTPANATNGGQEDSAGGASKEQKRILAETTRLLAKLENETQHISQGIMALSSAIEQMNSLINGGGEKTCFTSLGDIFFGGGMAKALEADAKGPVRYGHSSTMPTQSGTMT